MDNLKAVSLLTGGQTSRETAKRWTTIALLGLTLAGSLALLSFTGCKSAKKEAEPTQGTTHPGPHVLNLAQAQENSLGIATVPAREVALKNKINCNGQLQTVSSLQADIYTLAKGRVLSVPVNMGQTVSAGEVLASLKSDDVGQLQSDLVQNTIQSEEDIRQAQIQLDFSKAAYNRELELFKEGVSAKADMDSARQQYRKDMDMLQAAKIKRQASINVSQERLSLYGVSAENTRRMLATHKISPYLTIRAPRSGVIIERNVNVGELVDTTKNLFTVADLRELWITGQVYEKDVDRLKVGQPIEIELEDQPEGLVPGTLNFVSSVLNPQTRTMEVRGDITNPNLRLKPNMFARMSILVGTRNALAVPSNAVEKLGDYTYVFVNTTPHTYQERRVQVGEDNGQYVEIKEGLREGERVVTQGTIGLKGLVLKMASDSGE